MASLERNLRKDLARAILQAREVSEAGARAALETLAVHEPEPYGHLTAEQRELRRSLRAQGRQLGDALDPNTKRQSLDHLTENGVFTVKVGGSHKCNKELTAVGVRTGICH